LFGNPRETATLEKENIHVLFRFFDFGQTVFQLHGLYFTLITNFGNIDRVVNPVWTIPSSVAWAAFVYALVQVCFILSLHSLLVQFCLSRVSSATESKFYRVNTSYLSHVG
jgi:hypothetical protein